MQDARHPQQEVRRQMVPGEIIIHNFPRHTPTSRPTALTLGKTSGSTSERGSKRNTGRKENSQAKMFRFTGKSLAEDTTQQREKRPVTRSREDLRSPNE